MTDLIAVVQRFTYEFLGQGSVAACEATLRPRVQGITHHRDAIFRAWRVKEIA